MGNRIGWACIVVALAWVLGCGCAVVVNQDLEGQGNVPGRSTLEQIIPGETTVEWLLAVAGAPAHREQLEGGTEILRYHQADAAERHVAILLLLDSRSEVRKEQTVYIEAREGIVQRYWVETDDE